jgi:hypothetical protein
MHESGLDFAFELPSNVVPLPQPGEVIALALRSEAMDLLVENSSAAEGALV